ncbi:hypothetical protein KIN20_008419 [Parelaphostrongylus tenuis]|uniref:Uncharacterized protein n=1 Tax=Parelaphostrongylus tenuis TaxID=148309 RepID=A0AAD5QHH6_PARTN|nr:hypothetical protein KIN20_008419 [Parelaphostrongylus tenuis]
MSALLVIDGPSDRRYLCLAWRTVATGAQDMHSRTSDNASQGRIQRCIFGGPIDDERRRNHPRLRKLDSNNATLPLSQGVVFPPNSGVDSMQEHVMRANPGILA